MKNEGVNLLPVPRLALRVKEAAAAIGLSPWTVTREIREGRLRKTALNLISIEELQRYLREQTEGKSK